MGVRCSTSPVTHAGGIFLKRTKVPFLCNRKRKRLQSASVTRDVKLRTSPVERRFPDEKKRPYPEQLPIVRSPTTQSSQGRRHI
jgi:hypothetical protein